MSQSRAKATRRTVGTTRSRTRSKPASAEPSSENGSEQATQSEAPPAQLPGVVILRVPDKEKPGNENLQIMPLGGMDPLAIPTLLKLAIKIHTQSMGLNEEK